MDNNQASQPQAPQSPVIQTPEPATPRKSNPLVMVVGGVVIFGLGLLGGYFLFGNKSQPRASNIQIVTRTSPTPFIIPQSTEAKYIIYNGDVYKVTTPDKKELLISKNNLYDQSVNPDYRSAVTAITDVTPSPDKSKLLLLVDGGYSVPIVFVSDIHGSNIKQIAVSSEAVWSPTGKYIAYLFGHSDVGPYTPDVYDTTTNNTLKLKGRRTQLQLTQMFHGYLMSRG